MKVFLVIYATSFGDEDGCSVQIFRMTDQSFCEVKKIFREMEEDYEAYAKRLKKLKYNDPFDLIEEYHNEFLSPTHYVVVEGHSGSYLSFSFEEPVEINGKNTKD